MEGVKKKHRCGLIFNTELGYMGSEGTKTLQNWVCFLYEYPTLKLVTMFFSEIENRFVDKLIKNIYLLIADNNSLL